MRTAFVGGGAMRESIPQGRLDDTPGRRHLPSAGPRSSHAAGLAFAAYVTGTRQRIAAAVADLDAPPSQAVIEQRLPFELLPNPARASLVGDGRFTKAALLIHGLLDTPFILRDIATRFAEQGYLVRAVLLPGHGTRPGDLLAVSYREWIDAVAYGIEGLSEKLAGELTLVGFSLGATLAVHQALCRPAPDGVRIKALVMLSPALRVRGWAARFGPWLKPLGYLSAKVTWPAIRPDDDTAKYESLPLNAVIQFNSLVAEIGDPETGVPLTTPIFMAATASDATIDTAVAKRFFLTRAGGPRRMLWYAVEPGPAQPESDIEERASRYPDRRILDFSHVCLPVDPRANPHYGDRADAYRNCLHYFPHDMAKWRACMDGACADIAYGEPAGGRSGDADGSPSTLLRRLTFNPDFDHMIAEIFRFLDRLA